MHLEAIHNTAHVVNSVLQEIKGRHFSRSMSRARMSANGVRMYGGDLATPISDYCGIPFFSLADWRSTILIGCPYRSQAIIWV